MSGRQLESARGRLMDASEIPEDISDDLLRWLDMTSADRAKHISRLAEANPGWAEILIDIESDYDLATKLHMSLLQAKYR
jgi:hypothetical protein